MIVEIRSSCNRRLGHVHLILKERGGGWYLLEINILILEMLKYYTCMSPPEQKINNFTLTLLELWEKVPIFLKKKQFQLASLATAKLKYLLLAGSACIKF